MAGNILSREWTMPHAAFVEAQKILQNTRGSVARRPVDHHHHGKVRAIIAKILPSLCTSYSTKDYSQISAATK